MSWRMKETSFLQFFNCYSPNKLDLLLAIIQGTKIIRLEFNK